MNNPKEFIEEFSAKQCGGDFPCPRCGRTIMAAQPTRNALSRRARVHVCDECGTFEAVEDMAGGFKLPLSAWAIMKNPAAWEMPLRLTFVGRDSWSRPVYECGGQLYVDVDPRADHYYRIGSQLNMGVDGDRLVEIVAVDIKDTGSNAL